MALVVIARDKTDGTDNKVDMKSILASFNKITLLNWTQQTEGELQWQQISCISTSTTVHWAAFHFLFWWFYWSHKNKPVANYLWFLGEVQGRRATPCCCWVTVNIINSPQNQCSRWQRSIFSLNSVNMNTELRCMFDLCERCSRRFVWLSVHQHMCSQEGKHQYKKTHRAA